MHRAIREGGLRFWEAANGVILCEGNDAGYLPPDYFSVVIQLGDGLNDVTYRNYRRKTAQLRLIERLYSGASYVTRGSLTACQHFPILSSCTLLALFSLFILCFTVCVYYMLLQVRLRHQITRRLLRLAGPQRGLDDQRARHHQRALQPRLSSSALHAARL